MAKLQGMTVFTIADYKKGYWMVVLPPESKKHTCIVLPFGRFQLTRLLMGTVAAQDIFQSKLDSIFIGMEGVTRIVDDMVIAGRDEMEHDRNFLAFMEKCMSNNLRYRYSVLSAYLAAPLSTLTHQAMDYKPGKVHFENFNRLKVEISNMKVLPYFDVNAETTLQMDASKKGFGACLIQKGKVICYASRAQNLERQVHRTIWGMEKFHYFLYRKEFTLETNQKPLVSI